MVKKISKSRRRSLSFVRPLHIFLGLLLVLLVVYGLGLWYLFRENDVRATEAVAQMVITSVERLSSMPAPMDAASGKIYIHEMSLMLPPPPSDLSLGGVSYLYTPAFGLNGPQLELIDHSDVLNAEGRLRSDAVLGAGFNTTINNDISKLQGCTQGVTLMYDKQPAPDASKVLSNGKTIYFYWDADHRCVNNAFLQYVEQVTPY